jgi:hypothetical protein
VAGARSAAGPTDFVLLLLELQEASEALLCAAAGCGEWCRGCGAPSALGASCALRSAAAALEGAPFSGAGATLCSAWEAAEGRQAARAAEVAARAKAHRFREPPACSAEDAVEHSGADGWAAALRALHKELDGGREVRGGRPGW